MTLFWLFFLGKELFKNDLAGLLAVIIFAGSWEIHYHSRWIATDLLMVQWGTLSMLMLVKFINSTKIHFLALSSLFSGVATATKFQGGLYWLLGIGTILIFERRRNRKISRPLMASCVAYGAGYLICNLNMLLTPLSFVESMVYNFNHYATGHGAWVMEGGLPHARVLATYITTQISSPVVIVAVCIFILHCFGIIRCITERNQPALFLLMFPAVYFSYFSRQNLMIVRKYLCFLPFIALYAAYGGASLWRRASPFWRPVFLCLLCTSTLAHAGWLLNSSHSIRQYDLRTQLLKASEYVQHYEGTLLVSETIWNHLLSEQHRAIRLKKTCNPRLRQPIFLQG